MKKTKRYLQGGPVDASPDDGTGGGGAGVSQGGGLYPGAVADDVGIVQDAVNRRELMLQDNGRLQQLGPNRSYFNQDAAERLSPRGVDLQGLMNKRTGPGFDAGPGFKKGGAVKKMAKGGSTSSASKRADGCAQRGKTKGRFV